MKVLFRCDGGENIGLGHIMRCLSLAEAMRGKGWDISFALSRQTFALSQIILLQKLGVRLVELEEALDAKLLWDKTEGLYDLLIIDHYGLGRAYENAVRGIARAILVLDDEPERYHNCDFLLDAGFDRKPADYDRYVPDGCQVFTGIEYMPVRHEFGDQRRSALERRSRGDSFFSRIFINFGGMDGGGFCQKTVRALELCQMPLLLDIAIGAGATSLPDLEQTITESVHSVKLHIDCTDMAVMMANSDMAIGAGGISSWERCVVGLPTLVVCVAGNQRPGVDALVSQGAAIELDDRLHVTASQNIYSGTALSALVEQAQDFPSVFRKMSGAAASLCDGKGIIRLIDALECQMMTYRK